MSRSEHPSQRGFAAGRRERTASVPAGSRALGTHGEDLAVRHLQEAGLRVIDRNWRCPDGELDIIARDGAALVICEVKTRSGHDYGSPFEAVTAVKAQRLRRLAVRWLVENRMRFEEIRFDVVGVLCAPGERARVEHARGVC